MNHYAHTKADESGASLPPAHWEPLFSAVCPALDGAFCRCCADMRAGHGHLNKAGWLAWRANRDMLTAISGKVGITVGLADAMEASA